MTAVVAPVVLAVAVSQTWFRPGYFIAGGDNPPFVRTALENEFTWAWNHDASGAGSTSFQIVRGVEVLLIKGVRFLGGGEILAQRVLYALLLALVALGATLFARRFTSRPGAVALAGFFACVNSFVMTQVPNPLSLAALALMGVTGALVLKAAQGEPVSLAVFAVTTLGFSYLLSNPPLFGVACVWLAGLVVLGNALGGTGGTRRAIRLLALAAPLSLAINAWWVVPAALTFLGTGAPPVGTVTDVRAWAWTHVRASVGNLLALNGGWSWTYTEYTPFAADLDRWYWAWLRFAPPLACFSAPLLARGRWRRRSVVLLSVALGLVLVGKGLHPPVGELNLWLYEHAPAFWLLREPTTKVGGPLVLVYAALIAVAASAILDRLEDWSGRRRALGVGGAIVASVALLAYPYPLWNGTLLGEPEGSSRSSHVRIPEAWRAAAAYIDEEPRAGKALVLPLADYYQMPTTWGYYGVDVIPKLLLHRTAIQPLPESYFEPHAGFLSIVQSVERSLVRGRVAEVPRSLSALGVSHVVVRHDLDRNVDGRGFADSSALVRSLARLEGLRLARTFSVADVYEVAGPGAEVVQVRSVGETRRDVPRLSWRRDGPAMFSVEVVGATRPFVVVLAETYDPGWRLSGLPSTATSSHRQVDGYANGWLIEGFGDFRLTIEYRPAGAARLALYGSIAAAALLGTAAVVRRLGGLAAQHRRRQASAEAQHGQDQEGPSA